MIRKWLNAPFCYFFLTGALLLNIELHKYKILAMWTLDNWFLTGFIYLFLKINK